MVMEPEMERRPEEFALEYAGFWIRLGATTIDFIILLLILYLISQAVLKAASPDVPEWFFIPIFSCIFWILNIIYFVGFWAWRGQTPGKILTGIKIIRTDSSPVNWQYALLRYLGCIAATVIFFMGFIWIAFDSRKQGLHDKIADTYVVKLPVRQLIFTTGYLTGGKFG
jgi:uncharacterized RDD family membrane protein YckC